MPSIHGTTNGAWSIASQVKELRGKYNLKKKDLDSYRETSKSTIRKMDGNIYKLRQDMRRKHQLVADQEKFDQRVIRTVFSIDRKELLYLNKLTAERAIDDMHQMVCQAAQFLNALRYVRNKREMVLKATEDELGRSHLHDKPTDAQVAQCQEVRQLENNLDKAKVKFEMARTITRCYREILAKLREESLLLPAKLDDMEETVSQQKRDFIDIKARAKATYTGRDEAKAQLAKMLANAYEGKYLRDTELIAIRKEVERWKLEGDKSETRAPRASLLIESSDIKAVEVLREQEKKKTILSYEESFQRVMDAASVTRFEDALDRVFMQSQTNEHLKSQLIEQNNRHNRLLDAVTKLSQMHHDMKYTGEQKTSRGQRKLEELQKKLEDTEIHMQHVTSDLQNCGDLLVSIKVGISTLVVKLTPIKLRPPEHSFTKGDVFEQLELCRKKLEFLIAEMGNLINELPLAETHDPEFQAFMESQIPQDNMRIQIEKTDSIHTFNYMDSDELQDILTRADIKRLGQKLIDIKVKPRKRRVKKNK